MAFGLKYYAECLDYYGNLIRCEILGRDYTGAVSEMELTGDAIKLSRTNKDINEQICGMGVKISVWCNTDGQYLDLFATSDKENMVVVYRAGQVIFRGFIDPELYSEDFIAPPYSITIPASDGLAALTDYIPEIVESGRVLLLDVIRACLANTGLDLPIAINCSLFPDGYADSGITLFEKVYIDIESLYSTRDGVRQADASHMVLSDALKSFGCRIYQDDDKWYIGRVKNQCDDYWPWVIYAPGGGKETVQRYETVTLDTDDVWYLDNPASFEVDSGYGKQKVTINYGRFESIVPSNFHLGILNGESYWPSLIFDAPDKKWIKSVNNDSVIAFLNEKGIQNGVSYVPYEEEFPYIRLGVRTYASLYKGASLDVSFKVTIDPYRYDENVTYLFAQFRLGIKSMTDSRKNPFWLHGYYNHESGSIDQNGNTPIWYQYEKWDEFPAMSISTLNIPLHKKEYSEYSENAISIKFSIPLTDQMDPQSLMFFELTDVQEVHYYPEAGHPLKVYFGDIKISISGGEEHDNTFTATVNTMYRRQAPDVSMRFYDIPLMPESQTPDFNYSNGLSIGPDAFDYTSAWSDVQEGAEANKLYERMLIDNFDQHYDPREKLSGDIRTNIYLTPRNLYRVGNRGKYYMLTGLDYTVATAIYQAQIEEIKKRQVEIGNE